VAALSWRLIRLGSIILISVYSLIGCLSKIENQPLGQDASNLERRQFNFSDKTRPTVVLAFSGGGARAAALGYEVLRLLRRTTYVTATGQHNLLDDVAVISSVSGGSVTAAWFGLHPDNLDGLRSRFFNRDNMLSLMAYGR
jgi:NTE family protein